MRKGAMGSYGAKERIRKRNSRPKEGHQKGISESGIFQIGVNELVLLKKKVRLYGGEERSTSEGAKKRERSQGGNTIGKEESMG